MSELIIRSEQIQDLAAALAKAKLNYGVVVKTKENTYTHSKYAELQDLMDAIQKPLATEGLNFVHFPLERLNEKRAGALTLLLHSSGQFIGNELLLPATGKAFGGAEKLDAQTVTAAITYAKRCNVQGLGDVVGESEDDGNALADKTDDVPTAPKPKPVQKPAPVNQTKASTGGERPNDSRVPRAVLGPVTTVPALPVEPVVIKQPPAQTNDPKFDEVVPVQAQFPLSGVVSAAVETPVSSENPVESTTSAQNTLESSKIPTKSQFDTYVKRIQEVRVVLEKHGLKPSGNQTTGAKLKQALLRSGTVKELTEVPIYQWEDFLSQTEQGIEAGNPAEVVKFIEGGKVG